MNYKYTLRAPNNNLTLGFTLPDFPNVTIYKVWGEYFTDVGIGYNHYGRRIETSQYRIAIIEIPSRQPKGYNKMYANTDVDIYIQEIE